VFVHTSAIQLTKPAQYDELLRHVKEQFDRRLLMECAVSKGEVSTTDTLYAAFMYRSTVSNLVCSSAKDIPNVVPL